MTAERYLVVLWSWIRRHGNCQSLLKNLSFMEKLLNANWKSGDKEISFNVPAVFFQEEGLHFIYIPALDITGYGEDEGRAKASLGVSISEFFTYTTRKNTLFLELKRLGWKVKKEKKQLMAPTISDILVTNDQLRDIVNNKVYSINHLPIQMPAFA